MKGFISMRENPSVPSLKDKIEFYFDESHILKLMMDLEIDPKSLRSGETITSRQKEIIRRYVQRILNELGKGWEGKEILVAHLDFPRSPENLKKQILQLLETIAGEESHEADAMEKAAEEHKPANLPALYPSVAKSAQKIRSEIMNSLEEAVKEKGGSTKITTPSKMLGGGGLGHIFTLENKNEEGIPLAIGDQELVIKVSNRPFGTEKGFRNDPKFIEATQNTPELMKYFGSLHKTELLQGNIYMDLFERIKGKSLKSILFKKEMEDLYVDQALEAFVLPVIDGLEALHKAGYLHLDLKPDNVMISEDGKVKLGDYDLTVPSTIEKQRTSGSKNYQSPEQEKAGHLTPKSDIFSLGKFILKVLTDSTEEEDLSLIENRSLKALIRKCLNKNPEKRPTLQEVKQGLEAYIAKHKTPAA